MVKSIKEMLSTLDGMYDEEEKLKIEVQRLLNELEQLNEDKYLLQDMIMHQSNKKDRDKQ